MSNLIDIPSELGDLDILLGRGSGPCRNPGNIRFRALVLETYNEHLAEQRAKERAKKSASTAVDPMLNRSSRAQLVKLIREKTRELGCRFLQKVASPPGSDPPTKPTQEKFKGDGALVAIRDPHNKTRVTYFQHVEEKHIREKIKQALRFIIETENGCDRWSSSRSSRLGSPAIAALRSTLSAPNPLLQRGNSLGTADIGLLLQNGISPNASLLAVQQGQPNGSAAALPGYQLDPTDEGKLQQLLLLKLMEENRQAEIRLQEAVRAIAIQRILNQAQLLSEETARSSPSISQVPSQDLNVTTKETSDFAGPAQGVKNSDDAN